MTAARGGGAGRKALGCWCIFCGALVPQQHIGAHLWAHGIIHSDRRQGYRHANGQPPTLLGASLLDALAPAPPAAAQLSWLEEE